MANQDRKNKLSKSLVQSTIDAEKTIPALVSSNIEERFKNAEERLLGVQNQEQSEVVELLLSDIEDNPYNARAFYKQEEVDARARSIAKDGQLDHIKVARHPETQKLTMIDGQYRKRALESLGRASVSAKILQVSTVEDFYRLSYASNSERYEQTAIDNAVVWRKVLNDKIYPSEDALAKAIHVSPAKLNKILSITTLPKTTIDLMAESPESITWAVAYELVLFHRATRDDVATDLLCARIINEGLTKRAIEEIKKSATAVKPDRTHKMSRQQKVQDLPGVSGVLKDWDDGRLVLDIKVNNYETKQEIMQAIREKLNLK